MCLCLCLKSLTCVFVVPQPFEQILSDAVLQKKSHLVEHCVKVSSLLFRGLLSPFPMNRHQGFVCFEREETMIQFPPRVPRSLGNPFPNILGQLGVCVCNLSEPNESTLVWRCALVRRSNGLRWARPRWREQKWMQLCFLCHFSQQWQIIDGD